MRINGPSYNRGSARLISVEMYHGKWIREPCKRLNKSLFLWIADAELTQNIAFYQTSAEIDCRFEH